MATREEFLRHLWAEIINPIFRDSALDNIVSNCKRDPDGPFGEVGPAIERMLAAGISRRCDSSFAWKPTRPSLAPFTP
jgi:hypothetical protein